MLVTDLEDYEDEVHVTNGGKSRKRRNLIINDEELSVQTQIMSRSKGIIVGHK